MGEEFLTKLMDALILLLLRLLLLNCYMVCFSLSNSSTHPKCHVVNVYIDFEVNKGGVTGVYDTLPTYTSAS